jgi:hypothetical protein
MKLNILPLIFLAAAAASQIKADVMNPMVQYGSASFDFSTAPYTLGYQFTTTISFDINALGYFNDGFANNHEVGIWNMDGALMVSTDVLGTDPVTDNFAYDALSSDFILEPGSYVIGGEYVGSGNVPVGLVGAITLPGYTFVRDEQNFGSGLNFPTTTTNGAYGADGILAVNFSVEPSTSAIPEPASAVLLATMILGTLLIALGKRKNA